jgi:hypothetical protein
VSTDARKERYDIGAAREALAQESGAELGGDGIPRSIDRFFVVIRMLAGDALAPDVKPLRVEGDEQDAALVGAAEAGLKKMHERHADLAQGDGINLHGSSSYLVA